MGNRLELGPQTGAPPSLEQVVIGRLQVDPAYQRAADGPLSRRIILRMVKEWRWPLCQPLVVARRDDGSLWVLDGQHRLAGAKERGDVAFLPCVILPAIGAQEEARTFLALKTQRQQLTQTDIFLGMLAAGDEHAKATAELLELTGWRVVRTTSTKNWKPGDLVCAPALAAHLRVHGAERVRAALVTLRRAYPNDVVTAPAQLLNALVEIYLPGRQRFADQAKLTSTMARYSADGWMPKAHNYRLEYPQVSMRDALVELLLVAAGLRPRQVSPRPSTSISPPKVTAIGSAPAREVFDGEGRAWCGECEARVSRAKAAGCASLFCKVRAAA